MQATPPKSAATASGLDEVVFAHTELSDVDGEAGRLTLRGRDVERVAREATFEVICGLLWGTPPPALGGMRARYFAQLVVVPALESAADGMDAVRAAVASLQLAPEDAQDPKAAVTAAVGVAAAAWWRLRQKKAPLEPDPALSHAADLLRMVTGEPPSVAAIRALDTYLVTVSDHGMNASTFAARVVASTGSDLVSAVTAGVCALKGPLHGGAPGPVLAMLDAIGAPENAAAWIEAELAAGRRIMGMGHRIYRVRDPRAAVLEVATRAFAQGRAVSGRLALARAVEAAATGILRERHPTRPLHANVEFYTAVLLDAVGLPRELFSPVFAAARAAGWCAHFDEQVRVGRLIRPASKYVGPELGG